MQLEKSSEDEKRRREEKKKLKIETWKKKFLDVVDSDK